MATLGELQLRVARNLLQLTHLNTVTGLYYTRYPAIPGIRSMPLNGGEETEVIPTLEPDYWGYWGIAENGIYYLDTSLRPAIAFYDFASHGTKRVFELENRPSREVTGLAVSANGHTILYTQLDVLTRDIVLVGNYR
jgi:hypothetical protein